MTSLVVTVGGSAFSDWKEFEASRSVGEATASFDLKVSESRLVPPGWAAPLLRPGVHCTIILDGVTAITGRIDQVGREFDAGSHAVSVAGRGLAANIVDSSAILEGGSGQLRKQKLDAIAAKVLKPFGMAPDFRADPGEAFDNVNIQPGETAFAFLERLARQRGLLIHEDRSGALRFDHGIGEAASARLEEGVNILSGSSAMKGEGRFSEYIGKGQRKGDDQVYGEAAAHIEAKATDAAVEDYRPQVLLAEGWSDKASLRKRVDQEATARAAESISAEITVVGWLKADGSLWDAGDPAHVTAATLALDLDMVVKQVTWSLNDSQGTLTQLSLVPPEALDSSRSASGGQGSAGGSGRGSVPGDAASGGKVATDGGWLAVKPAEPAQ